MYKKLLPCILFIVFFQMIKAQNEFITIWKPGNSQQIRFPGRGQNFSVYWEEVGYPQHNGTISNITSVFEFIVNFSTPLNPVSSQATYRIKISDGNGHFDQVRFFDNSVTPAYTNQDMSKIIQITQWGNIKWKSFEGAFIMCDSLDMTATDVPDLSLVTSLREMFQFCFSFIGNPSLNNWNTSTITDMYYMFGDALQFNQPLGSWNTSNVIDMGLMFDNTSFNQPIGEWDTSKVTNMEHMFHSCHSFNQYIGGWNTSKVTNMNQMFNETAFNQNIGYWNLASLTTAIDMFYNSAMSCQNYDDTLYRWSLNPVTPNNINLSNASPSVYSHPKAVIARNHLLNNKGWTISGDLYDPQCQSILSTSETEIKQTSGIYPNPAKDMIYLKNIPNPESYTIHDTSGRMIIKDFLHSNTISIESLPSGNYILRIITKDKIHPFKFIKK